MAKGYIYITRSGYDPQKGKRIKDPYLGSTPTLGACMPNIRSQVVAGDFIFAISGKVAGLPQFIFGGFEVAEKIDAMAAYRRFPALRLHRDSDGHPSGNIIVTPDGAQHPLDGHDPASFQKRIQNYVIGKDPLALCEPEEVAKGREETLQLLRDVLGRPGLRAIDVVGRWSRLDATQVSEIRDWMLSIKTRR